MFSVQRVRQALAISQGVATERVAKERWLRRAVESGQVDGVWTAAVVLRQADASSKTTTD